MKIEGIKETCIYIEDIEATKYFYHGKLGLPVIGLAEDRHVFFKAGDSVLLCFIAATTKEEDKLPPHYGQGHLHFAFECKRENYQDLLEEVKNSGIHIEKEIEWSNSQRSFYFRDPDDHCVEVVMEGLWE